jgi:hypothetical protein
MDELSSKRKSRRAENDHDLLGKDSNLEVIFAKKETTFKQHEADYVLREVQIPQDLQQRTEGKYSSVDVNTNQLGQESKIPDYTHETRENVEPTTFLHVNRK